MKPATAKTIAAIACSAKALLPALQGAADGAASLPGKDVIYNSNSRPT